VYLELWHDLKTEMQTRIFFFFTSFGENSVAEMLTATKAHFCNIKTFLGYSNYFAIVQ